MAAFFETLKRWHDADTKFALARVVKTWGSAPRPAGSMMIVSQAGEMCGSVSGGCVETAVVEAAQQVIGQRESQLLHFGVSNDDAWAVGLACGGQVEVFVEPWLSNDPVNLALLPIWQSRQIAMLITRIDGLNDAHLLLTANGERIGSTGKAELDIQFSQRYPADRFPRSASTETIGDAIYFAHPFLPPPRLVIVGGVHIAQPLVTFAKALDFEVLLVDPRTAFGNRERFPQVDQIFNEWPDEAIAKIGIDQNSFFVLLSHDAKIDDPALLALLGRQPAYVGALGSRKTHKKRMTRLLEAGLSDQQIARIHAPIGLKIGAVAPVQIAASIIAEIISVQQNGAKG